MIHHDAPVKGGSTRETNKNPCHLVECQRLAFRKRREASEQKCVRAEGWGVDDTPGQSQSKKSCQPFRGRACTHRFVTCFLNHVIPWDTLRSGASRLLTTLLQNWYSPFFSFAFLPLFGRVSKGGGQIVSEGWYYLRVCRSPQKPWHYLSPPTLFAFFCPPPPYLGPPGLLGRVSILFLSLYTLSLAIQRFQETHFYHIFYIFLNFFVRLRIVLIPLFHHLVVLPWRPLPASTPFIPNTKNYFFKVLGRPCVFFFHPHFPPYFFVY